MNIGDEVIWRENVQHDRKGIAYRITKGVIIGQRKSKTRTEFEIAVRWYSGSMPRHPRDFMWVPVQTVLFGLTDDRMVSVKTSPLALAKRWARKETKRQGSVAVRPKAA